MMDLSALFRNKIFLGLERCWCAVNARSISTVSWSLLKDTRCNRKDHENTIHISKRHMEWFQKCYA
jgi:hypothetical protein